MGFFHPSTQKRASRPKNPSFSDGDLKLKIPEGLWIIRDCWPLWTHEYMPMSANCFRTELGETHPFIESSDGFHCSTCGKPRAVHLFDGFVPSSAPPHCSMDPKVRYSRHSYFTRPGSLFYIKTLQHSAPPMNRGSVRPGQGHSQETGTSLEGGIPQAGLAQATPSTARFLTGCSALDHTRL